MSANLFDTESFLQSIKIPGDLPNLLYTSQQIKTIEQDFAKAKQCSTYALMQAAGQAAFDCLQSCWPQAQSILVACGNGNNAGDGYVLAKLAADAGYTVHVLKAVAGLKPKGDAAIAYQELYDKYAHCFTTDKSKITQSDIIVDALLGTGIKGTLRPAFVELITAVNQSSVAVLALDLPSGLDADTGSVATVAVAADVTLAFVGLKQGMVTGAAKDYCGTVYCHPLGVTATSQSQQQNQLLTLAQQQHLIQVRQRNSHKGDHGHVVVVGGNRGMMGASLLSARAALRLGSGFVSVFTHVDHSHLLTLSQAELMVQACAEGLPISWPKHRTVLVCGPGLGQDTWAQALWQQVQTFPGQTVIDADGLNLLAKRPKYHDSWVLTPHPGEAANLLGVETKDIQADRFTAAKNIAKRFGGVCILKGAGTIVATETELVVVAAGNPGMASAGMGDVLAGAVGAFLAQGYEPFVAAKLAALLHSSTADALVSLRGELGLIASDLIDAMPAELHQLMKRRER